MTKRSEKAKSLDTREIIDKNSRLIDALKNLNHNITLEGRKNKTISGFTPEDTDCEDLKDTK